MAELNFIKTAGVLVPADDHTKEVFEKYKAGGVIKGDFKQVRNPKYHRRFFALLNLSFEYWEPSAGVLQGSEKNIIKSFVNALSKYMDDKETIKVFARHFLENVVAARRNRITTITKSFEAFRKEILVEAGFYELVHTTSGIKKQAESISFAKMDEDRFREVYKAVFSVCWNRVLCKTFPTEQEAENAINNLMSLV